MSRISRHSNKHNSAGDVSWHVKPPSYRFDISQECDLIEEVARVNGYDQFPASNPRMVVSEISAPEEELDTSVLKQCLTERGYREAITYSFVDPELQGRLFPKDKAIPLQNPLSPNLSVMRVSLIPGLLQALVTNMNRQHRRIRLFELGTTFHRTDAGVEEVQRLSGVISGTVWPEQWAEPARLADFFDVKGDIEALIGLTRDEGSFTFAKTNQALVHPGQSAQVKKSNAVIGYLGRLHPDLERSLDVPQAVFVFELEMSFLAQQRIPAYLGISRFPAIRRDLAVVVEQSVSADEILNSVRKSAGEHLTNLELFDVFQREGLDSKTKSLAFSLTLRSSSRTLIDSEVESIVDRTLDELRRRFGAELRT